MGPLEFLSVVFMFVAIPQSYGAVPAPVIKGLRSVPQETKDYLQFLKQFAKSTCPQNDRKRFEALYHEFKGGGFYVPTLADDQPDREGIKKNLPLLRQKLNWITTQKANLPKKEVWDNYTQLVEQMSHAIDEVLSLQEKLNLEPLSKDRQNEVKGEIKKALIRIKEFFQGLIKEVPFLTNFSFPVDHLAHRAEFESATGSKKKELLLQRKWLEDGAMDTDLSGSDMYLRTSLDTLALRIEKIEIEWDDSLRYDLEWALKMVDLQLARGREAQFQRLGEWQSRTERALNFYQELINNPTSTESKDLQNLKDFVQAKGLKVYKYLAKQPEKLQALYSVDQILLNEVGEALSSNELERKGIAQIVVNRRFTPPFNELQSTQELYHKLVQSKKFSANQLNKFPWLNTLFREGEFSFTYYIFEASMYLFCPDFSPVAKKSRKKNISTILQILKKPERDFKAIRYFSRVSMVGRIDMAKLWTDYKMVSEQPGRKIVRTKRLLQAIDQHKYRYFYSFTAAKKKRFDVLEVKGITYAVSGFPARPVFYTYRDPNKFAFFELRPR